MSRGLVLVVGGAGYIGSHMVMQLHEAGFAVVVADNLSAGRREAVVDVPLRVGDIGDGDFSGQLLHELRPDAVIHFASHIQVGESMAEPGKYYGNNVEATRVLLESMRRAGVRRFIFSSTAAIFGDPEYVPIDEAHPKRPVSPYGRSKWFVEQMLEDYGRAHGLASVCLRYFNAAGADPDARAGECHEPETHLIPLVLQAASGRRGHVAIFGTDYDTPDGTCIRDYVHVVDLCDAHMLALRHLLDGGGSERYNLGNGNGFSVREVIEAACRVTGREVRVVEQPRREGDPPRLVADSTKARACLGWVPRLTSLERIIEDAWRWEQTHYGHAHGAGPSALDSVP
jgi:UDP-glucose 4-epimerase